MQFAHPLLLILIPPALVGLRWLAIRHARMRHQGRKAMVGSRQAELTPALAEGRARWKSLLVGAAVVLLLVALARPQFGTRYTHVKREGLDIIFAIDTSLSMTAEDLRPNRLERARLEIEALLPRLGGNRVGIVAFAGAAFVQCPLTLDHGALRIFLDGLSPNLIPRPGTHIEAAISKSINAFPGAEEASRVIVLLSDGEGFEGEAERAGKVAAERGIVIHSVGIGSPEGEPIPVRDEQGNSAGYKKDDRGQVIMSRLDETTLSRLAAITGGRYYRVSGGGFALDEVMDDIATMAKKETESRFVTTYEERFQAPLLAALLLILIDAGLVLGRRRLALIVLALCLTGVDGARADEIIEKAQEGGKAYGRGDFETALNAYKQAAIDAPERADLQYNVGTTLLRLGQTEDAVRELERAAAKAVDAPLLQRDAHYNRGNTHMNAEDYSTAVDAFQQALDVDPEDDDALHNLELALRKLQEQQQQQQDQQQQEQDQEENEEENQEKQQQEQQQEDEDQQDEEQQEQNQEQEDDQQQQPESEESNTPEIDPQQAAQILDAIAAEEQDLHQRRARLAVPVSDEPEKDW